MPTRVLTLVALTMALLAGCTDDQPESAPESTGSPTASPSPVSPEPAPTPTASPLDPFTWQSAEHPGLPYALHPVDGGFIGFETGAVARLTDTGEDVWRHESKDTDGSTGLWVDGRPVAVQEAGPKDEDAYRPQRVQGLDPRTGDVVWEEAATSRYVVTDGDRVVAPTCTGEETGSVGDCTLTAYDGATGAVEWTRATWANVEQWQVGDGVLVAQTFPEGAESRMVVLDAETGAVRATLDPAGGLPSLFGDVLVDEGPLDAPVREGCQQVVTGYGLDGAQRWQRTFQTGPQERRKKKCDNYLALPVQGAPGAISLGSLYASPLLLDARTGETLWRGETPNADVDARVAGLMVVSGDERTEAIDVETGEVVWVREGHVGRWLLEGRYLAGNQTCPRLPTEAISQCSVVVDVRTGQDLLDVAGVAESFVEPGSAGGPAALLVRVEAESYAASYGYLALPPLS